MASSSVEVAKTLPDNPNYLVTIFGQVFSCKYGKVRQLKTPLDNHGYPRVDIYKGGRAGRKTIRLHMLVALTFGLLKPGQEEMVVNHKDHDKSNCSLRNLELVTRSENTKHWHKGKGSK